MKRDCLYDANLTARYKKTKKITLTEQETKVFKELAKEFNYE